MAKAELNQDHRSAWHNIAVKLFFSQSSQLSTTGFIKFIM